MSRGFLGADQLLNQCIRINSFGHLQLQALYSTYMVSGTLSRHDREKKIPLKYIGSIPKYTEGNARSTLCHDREEFSIRAFFTSADSAENTYPRPLTYLHICFCLHQREPFRSDPNNMHVVDTGSG